LVWAQAFSSCAYYSIIYAEVYSGENVKPPGALADADPSGVYAEAAFHAAVSELAPLAAVGAEAKVHVYGTW